MALSVRDLMRVAQAGGGLRLDARAFRVYDLVQIVSAGRSGARFVIPNSAVLRLHEMVQIANAAPGAVLFEPT